MRYDCTTPEGAHQQQQFETLRRSLTCGVEEAASQDEGDQDVEGGLGSLSNSGARVAVGLSILCEESEENDARVPVPCAHGGIVHASYMTDRAEYLARGHAALRPCVVHRSACPEGSRPSHSAELDRRLSMNGHEGR